MKKLFLYLRQQDRNELTYWVGLLMLFAGMWLMYSAGTALLTTGAAMAAESVLTSYMAAWLNSKQDGK